MNHESGLLFRNLIQALKEQGIQFCHWKSNINLGTVSKGEAEYDLFVARRSAQAFETIVAQCGFKRAQAPHAEHIPAVHHYYGYDVDEDLIIHIHVFFRLITGESITKNYRLPLEGMITQDYAYQGGVPTPSMAAQLIIFVLRMMVKHGSLIEAMLAWREYDSIIAELEWLTADEHVIGQAYELLGIWVPTIDRLLFHKAVDALRDKSAGPRRLLLGRVFKARLKSFRRYSPLMCFVLTAMSLSRTMHRKLRRIPSFKAFPSGGAVIAFVGPEATGKSTMVTNAYAFLKRFCKVDIVHLGKPPATVLTVLPSLFLPFARAKLPGFRPSHIEAAKYDERPHKESPLKMLLLALRSIMVAWDRRVLATIVFQKAARGEIVICDRYPSQIVGAADSPRLTPIHGQGILFSIYHKLLMLERKLYASIVPPDYVVCLSVPVEVAIERNVKRMKSGKESEEYVRRRHAESDRLVFPSSIIYRVATDKPLEESIREIRGIMWEIR